MAEELVTAWQQQSDALHACLAAKQSQFHAVPQSFFADGEGL
jgi:hypothetical protein